MHITTEVTIKHTILHMLECACERHAQLCIKIKTYRMLSLAANHIYDLKVTLNLKLRNLT